jgi:hypothetical protein
MRIFDVLNIQHFVLYLFPALAFVLLFAAGLSYTATRRKGAEKRMARIIEEYPGGIQGRNAPFPLFLTLVIAGTLLWSLLYIIFVGTLGVKI